MMMKILNTIFHSCKDITVLVEKKEVVGLTLLEKLRYKGHLLMCSACRSFERQSALLEKMFERVIDKTLSRNEPVELDKSSKAKILEELKKVQ